MDLLVIGGAASGKSAYAERRCVWLGGPLVYVATMEAFGAEGRERVVRHRALRTGKGFATIECPRDVGDWCRTATGSVALDGATVLLEGLGTLVANELFAPTDDDGAAGDGDPDEAACRAALERIEDGLRALDARAAHLVCVTDAVSSDGVAYPAGTATYQQVLAAANRVAAASAREVVEVACGIPVSVTGRGASSAPAFLPGASARAGCVEERGQA